MKLQVVLAVSAALLMGGCDMEPNLLLPTVALSPRYKEAPSPSDVPLDPSGQWWKSFRDHTLDDLEAQVEIANPDLAAALAANDRARAFASAAQAGLYPEIDGVGGLSYNRQSNNRPLRSPNQPTYFGANEIDAQVASYEVDFWGRVRDLIKAANAQAQASADALAQAKLELHAELASAYIQLRGVDAEAKLLADTVANYQAAYDLTRRRLEAQIAPPIDVERAQTQLETAKAQAYDLYVRRSSLEDAIAALVGQSASSFKIAPTSAPIATPRRPRATPADVLLRRPDVAESERFIEAANAGIGVARAAFYPRFTISLLGGSQDTGLNLLTPGNSIYSVGPTMSLPLFDGGLRKAQLEAANASYAEAVGNYRSTILGAIREVEDNLSALRWLADELRSTVTAAEAARKAAEMALALYRDGASSYLDVVTAQTAALDAERLVIVLRTRQLDANVALMLALGGGWSAKADETSQM